MNSTLSNPSQKICRLCLSDSGVILPIFDGEVAESFTVPLPQKILSCLSIKVSAEDSLASHICHRCLYKVDHFHEFQESCKKTNSTFDKIGNNSSDCVQLDSPRDLHDVSVYHDALSDLLSDGETISNLGPQKRLRSRPLIESVKRVQHAQNAINTAESVGGVPAQLGQELSANWVDTSKSINTVTDPEPEFECRLCFRRFTNESSFLRHENLHTRGVIKEELVEQSDEYLPIVQNCPASSAAEQQTPPPASAPAAVPPPQSPALPPQPSDAVTLTDVTAILLEETFDNTQTTTVQSIGTCRYCAGQFGNLEFLKRHERLYCSSKPPLLKLNKQEQPQPIHQPPKLQPDIEQSQQQQPTAPTEVQQNSQPPSAALVQEPHQSNTHLEHNEQPGALQLTHLNRPQPQEESDDSCGTMAARACKYCNKDFVHRGSLWRHQMFCDSNPDKDKNRAVAGKKRKTFASKSFLERRNTCSLLSTAITAINQVQERTGQIPIAPDSSFRPDLSAEPSTANGNFKCKYCDKRFQHRGSWWRHQKMFCSDNPEIPSVKAAAKEQVNQHGAPVFSCRYCDRTFLHRGSCWHHEQTHNANREHTCRYCSKAFSERSRVARHERMHLGIKPFVCRQCGKAFCDASNLRNHEQIHGERASYLCAWCGKSYSRRALLLKHEQTHAGEGQVFTCLSCPRTFPDIESLNTHSLTHNERERRSYFCQSCGQVFRTHILLAQHTQQVHINLPQVQQHIQAQQASQPAIQPSPQQTAHQPSRSGHDIQLHACNICDKAFTDSSSLRHHQLLHASSPRQYRCNETSCRAIFQHRSQLEAHHMLHNREKPHVISPVPTTSATSFHQHQHHDLLQAHQLQQQHAQLHQHELLPQDRTYVLDAPTIAVHHLVGQLPQ